jgi:hypothetical protein
MFESHELLVFLWMGAQSRGRKPRRVFPVQAYSSSNFRKRGNVYIKVMLQDERSSWMRYKVYI